MPVRRTPAQVAKRAVILAALSMRGSFEVTSDPRARKFSTHLLPWLTKIGCGSEVDPFEREQFQTPYGTLSESQWLDVRSAGEASNFYLWTLQVVKRIDLKSVTEPPAYERLPILRPECSEIIDSARLRPVSDVESMVIQIVLVRSLLQESRLDPAARPVLRRANLAILKKEFGLTPPNAAISYAEGMVYDMTPEERSTASGLSYIRHHAAGWLFSDRSTYYERDE